MSVKTIALSESNADLVLDLIEGRLFEIGKTYSANGRSWGDDLLITELRAIARELGHDFEILANQEGFSVTRVELTPA